MTSEETHQTSNRINWANVVTLSRTALVFIVVALIYPAMNRTAGIWATLLTGLIIWMDGWDGFIARKYGFSSKAGAVLDIIGDRVVEQVYWLVFAGLGWIPLWMVLSVIVRGVLVDGLRSLALEEGLTAFGSSSMMQSPLGIFLVSSRFSRWFYAVVKALLFVVAIAAHLSPLPKCMLAVASTETWLQWTNVLAWATVIFCWLRGLPVLIEGRRFLRSN